MNTLAHAAFAPNTRPLGFLPSDRARLKRNGCPPAHLRSYAARINAQAKQAAVHYMHRNAQYQAWFEAIRPGRDLPKHASVVINDTHRHFQVEANEYGHALLTDAPEPENVHGLLPADTPANVVELRPAAPKALSAAQWRALLRRVLACDETAILEAQQLLRA